MGHFQCLTVPQWAWAPPFFISKLKFSYDKYSVDKVWTKNLLPLLFWRNYLKQLWNLRLKTIHNCLSCVHNCDDQSCLCVFSGSQPFFVVLLQDIWAVRLCHRYIFRGHRYAWFALRIVWHLSNLLCAYLLFRLTPIARYVLKSFSIYPRVIKYKCFREHLADSLSILWRRVRLFDYNCL